MRVVVAVITVLLCAPIAAQNRYKASDGQLRVALAQQPLGPNGPNIVMAGVRLTDPLEQRLLDDSRIEQLSVDDLRNLTPAVWQQMDRLNRISDTLYIHIDMDVLDRPK